ncbi:hypothetical protein GKQ38_01485 [Candidatus Nanohaloarchaea archaeon]|nr:hypothetical protein GKQ38_01485 [Candidatus Nanohaloarchaea archaeon]
MSAGRNLAKSLALISTLLVTVSLAASASAWQINLLGTPSSYQQISPYGGTVQYIEIVDRDTGTPITKSILEDSGGRAEWIYKENGTFQAEGDLNYLKDGIWYVRHTVGNKSGSFRFEVQQDNLDPEANKTKAITVTNTSVEILTDMSDPYLPGREDARIEVNVTNNTNGEYLSGATVEIKITNTTYISTQNLNEDTDNKRYELYAMDIPDAVQQQYALHVIANVGGQTSVTTQFISTMDYLNTSVDKVQAGEACGQQSMPTSCEPGATLDLGLNVTSAYAENVTLQVLKDSVEGGMTQVQELELTENQETGLYEGQITYPQIDTSSYEDKLVLKFISENNYSQHVSYYNISKASFEVSEDMNQKAYQGSQYGIKFSLMTPYTGNPYNASKFASADLSFKYPNGTTYRTLSKSNLSYDSETGWVTGDVLIEQGAPNGSYTLDAQVSNMYGTTKSFTHSFEVLTTSQIFSATDQITVDLQKQKNYTKNFTITNKLSSSITVNPEVNGDIQGIANVNSGQNIDIAAGNSTNVTVEFDIDEVQDYSGEIVLHDTASDYNETVDVELNAPDCGTRNATICVSRDGWINVTRVGRGQSSETFTLNYLGPEEDVAVEIGKRGEAASHISISNTSFNLSDSREITLNYTINEPVNVTGEIFVNSTYDITIPTEVVGDFAQPQVNMSVVKDTVDLGVIQALQTDFKVEVQNNGTTAIDYFESTDQVTIEDYNSIDPSSTGNITLNISREDYGLTDQAITLTAYRANPANTQEELSGSSDAFQLVARFMPETEAAAQNITSWADELMGKTFSSSMISRLEQAKTNATIMRDEFSKGNDKKAFRIYQTTMDNLASMEEEINSNTNTGGQNGGTGQDDATDDQQGQSGDSSDSPTGNPSGDAQKKSGGAGILPIILVVLILVVAGFIFYTSYIPEPGDPLYEYLGEQQ